MMRFGENMELYNEYELISHSKLADCSMFIVDMVYRPMHLHKEMELCYILSGTCRVSTDRQSFTAGAGGVLLFDAGAGHEIWAVGAPASKSKPPPAPAVKLCRSVLTRQVPLRM